VPLNIRFFIGRREIIRSLGTHDLKVARKAVIEMADELDKLFSKIQMGAEQLSPSDLAEFSNAFCASKTQALIAEALVDFDDRKVEDEEWDAFHARTFRQEVLTDLRYSRLSSAEPEVDALLSQHNVILDRGSALYKQLCRATLQGLADFYDKAEIILKGGFDDPRVVAEQTVSVTQITGPNSGDVTFGIAIEKYLNDQKPNWSAKQFTSQSAKLQYFLSYLSEANNCDATQLALSAVTNTIARSYKEHLQVAPSNAKKKYPNLSPIEQVKAAKQDNAAPMSSETQNNYLQCLSTLYSFAESELDYQDRNPFKGRGYAKATRQKARDRRSAFSNDQLTHLFSSPIYMGCKSLPACHAEGRLIPRDSHKYWVPLIGLFTGMRLQEILQLYLEDVYQHDGLWVFDLNENHPDKNLKTPQSKRLVPIHSDLIAMGLIDLWEKKKTNLKDKRLFEDAKVASDGTYSSTFSKWFSRYLTNIGIKTAKTSFHSLRHNMKDGFRNSGASDELAENFMGRSTGTTGEAYGSGYSVQSLHDALHTIKFTTQIAVLKTQREVIKE
jgi:integrase